MKFTRQMIKQFESEQKQFGTEVALGNVLRSVAFDIARVTGVKKIKFIGRKQ